MDEHRVRILLREAGGDTSRVVITHHAQDRMAERGITWSQVVRCLAKGQITEGPAPDIKGGWKVTVETVSAGDRLAVVAAVTEVPEGTTIVVTAYYPDQ